MEQKLSFFFGIYKKRHSKRPLWKCNKCKLIMSHQGFNKIFQITKYVTERFYIPKKSYIVNVRKRRCCSYNFVSIHKSCCNNIHTKCQLQGVKLFSSARCNWPRKSWLSKFSWSNLFIEWSKQLSHLSIYLSYSFLND